MFTIDFDLTKIRQTCNAIRVQTGQLANHAAEKSAKRGLEVSTSKRRYQDKTGRLAGKTEVVPKKQDALGGEYEIQWNTPYAKFIDEGTKAHKIAPKNSRFLVFFWAKKGRLYVGRGKGGARLSVNHPGTKPYAFAGEAYMVAERELLRQVEIGAQDIERAINR